MGFFKKIINVEIIDFIEGISEEDELSNYAAGHMMGGFEGMVNASLLNDSYNGRTVFRLYYDNGTFKDVIVVNGSYEYNKYIRMIK